MSSCYWRSARSEQPFWITFVENKCSWFSLDDTCHYIHNTHSPHEQQTSFQQQMLPAEQTLFTHYIYTLQEGNLNDFTFSILNLSNCFVSLCVT